MLTAVKRNGGGANKKRQRAKHIVGLSLIALLSYTGFSQAAQRVVVNEAQIQVEDQSQRTQQAAQKKALQQVLVKMSGSTGVLENAGVRAALTSPQSLLRSYRFSFENNKTYYVAEFDQSKLNELLQREMLPLWGDRRPETIVWLAKEENNDARVILDESLDTELQRALKQTAKERGIPLSLPLMDLTDSVNISSYDVWGRFAGPLRKASARYSVDNIIGARVYRNDASAIPDLPDNVVPSGTVESLDDVLLDETQSDEQETESLEPSADKLDGFGDEKDSMQSQQLSQYDTLQESIPSEQSDTVTSSLIDTSSNTTLPFTMDEFADYARRASEGEYALDWVFIGGGKVSYGSIYGDSPEALGSQLIDAYSNYLSSLYAIVGIEASEREVVNVSIANIGSISRYASATDYLNSLSVIENASLVEQSGTVATYSLILIGTYDDLLNSIKLESKLRPVTDAYGQTVEGHSFYWSN
ncbi:DUF2066 domain-containing protein [Alteromonas sp. IB21]|uniref:DUF2066 domain-containing protein n=1 Tax=Alteromonas sp. IB21 TaxID=2779369 RepID=UPI0018E87B95|nr:DUF2066 domain-containing protein [Alteromonas sp. IB21]MBJ2128294.1 DUF2066 domain-containing protein [Alteromonas sp. IB21]